MKKILVSAGILLAAFVGVGLFTEDPLTLAFFGIIAGLFALMTFWAVKHYVELRKMGVKRLKGIRREDEEEPREDKTEYLFIISSDNDL